MKKFLGLILAVAFVAAGIAPAMAGVDVSGEVRVRYQNMNNADFSDAAADSSSATTQRTRLNANFTVDDQTSAYISVYDARGWGEDGATAVDGASVGLNKAYLQMKNVAGPVGIKIGRQALAYGNQRLVGSLEWADQGRRFDGLKLMYGNETVSADLFLTDVATNAGATGDEHLNGLYVTLKNLVPANTLDVYYLQDVDNTAGVERDMNTMGLRLAGMAAGADWTVEYAMQGGDLTATVDQDATLMAVTAGYTLADVLGGLRIGGEFFDASGDDATTADSETFMAGYSTGHFHYGILDLEGNSDIKGFALKLQAKPVKGIKVKLEYWAMEESEVAAGATAMEINETNIQVHHNLTDKVKGYLYIAQGDSNTAARPDNATLVGYMLGATF